MTKLGPLVHHTNAQNLAWVKRSAVIVKQMNGVDALQAAPDSAIRVFRLSAPNEMDTSDPQGTANRAVAALGGYWHRNLHIQLWTGAHPTLNQLKQAVIVCHMSNLKTVGSSWYTGDYTQQDWDIATNSGVDLYAPQCYWGTQGFTEDHALRYRHFWKPGNVDVVILECSRDKVEGGAGGYYILKPSWTDQQVANDLAAYDTEIAKDSYVLGATPFECGPTQDWIDQGFDLDNAAHLIGLGGIVVTQDELQRIASDIYKRANVALNATGALYKYWFAQFQAGHYLGVPTEPEHDSEDGTLVLQAFAGAYLWCKKSDYAVQASKLPFA